MKRIFALLLVVVVGFFIFTELYSFDNESNSFPEYGESNLENRVSEKYINKSVNGSTEEVEFNKTKDPESGSANIVTSIVVNYRSFDTLGELTVLFISALGVSLLLEGKKKRIKSKVKPSFILKYGVRIILGLSVVYGVYMITHGHLSPGGGFPGGSIIAASVLMLYLADDDFRVKVKAISIAEGLAGSFYIIIGLIGLFVGGYFLKNFLPNGTVGELISAGIIPVVYILIGVKVGAELSGIMGNFLSEEVVE